ncbi:5'-3' exoribonuclease 1 isoform X1-like, partial [Tropilaelaps mercedesae]
RRVQEKLCVLETALSWVSLNSIVGFLRDTPAYQPWLGNIRCLPEFDNLYLDMNGIIHVCSHPNDTDAHFRISEEDIFKNIFDYIDFIFRIVKPKKCFFMAVDGVAPRAKMNQQRDRRFRSAKEAEKVEKEARKKGETLPVASRFDSNCISPGTEFMDRLHEQLKYFIVQKLSEDPAWQKEGLKIYLSGHNAPGEGEHKAMDFIRYIRSQEDYDPNTRHCIYGQDADLIMLALCTHEPHIALLREEVVFGKQSQKRILSADKVTFHLLHISLLREYLDHEFSELKEPGVLKQGYNLENIIDDWLLMCFLVGNDFLPHLPNLHIAHDALPMLYRTYCDVMPGLGGYLQERGQLNLKNFEVFMRKLGERDMELFEDQKADQKYLKGKMSKGTLDEARRKFPGLDILNSDDDEVSSDDSSEEEFRQHKRHYYMTKMDYKQVTERELREQAEGYIRAVQWSLHYYYDGVQSWSWYYPHHYSPFISDIKGFSDLKVEFEMGEPFLPFQQLVSIMPAASRELVPQAYRGLMINHDSPLRDYFPDDFETDLNGKTQPWEAVVLIKYIEKDILLNSMAVHDNKLTESEKNRNRHGPHLLLEYSTKRQGSYKSPMPHSKWFPSIKISYAKCTEVPNDMFRLQKSTIKKGRLKNVKDSLYFPGFPSLRLIPHRSSLVKQGCTVFQQPSRNYNMIVNVDTGDADITKYANLVGQVIHIDYPHFRQALVTKISDGRTIYSAAGKQKTNEIEAKEFSHTAEGLTNQLRTRWGIETGEKSSKLLITCRPIIGRKYIYQNGDQVTIERQWADQETVVLHSTIISGVREHEVEVAQFRTVRDVFSKDKLVFLLSPNEYGLKGTVCGYQSEGYLLVETRFREEPDFSEIHKREPELRKKKYLPSFRVARELGIEPHLVARLTGCIQVQLNSTDAESSQTVNIGMNLKFNKTNEEVVGFSKKVTTLEGKTEWRFSEDTVSALKEMITNFGEFYSSLRACIEMDKIPLEKFYPGESYKNGLNTARELARWIKDQTFTKAPRQKCGAIVFDEGVVEAIQQHVDEHIKGPEFEQTVRVHAKDTYLPGLHLGLFAPDKQTSFSLYDRVINVRPDITVPLGLKGTVIGIHRPSGGEDEREATYEILFDEEFPTGTQTRGAQGLRVATLSVVSMINITHGQRVRVEQAQKNEMLRRGHGVWGTKNPLAESSKKPQQNTAQTEKQKPINGLQKEQKLRVLQREVPQKSPKSATPASRATSVPESKKICEESPSPAVSKEQIPTDNIITRLFASIPAPIKSVDSGSSTMFPQGIPITVEQLFGRLKVSTPDQEEAQAELVAPELKAKASPTLTKPPPKQERHHQPKQHQKTTVSKQGQQGQILQFLNRQVSYNAMPSPLTSLEQPQQNLGPQQQWRTSPVQLVLGCWQEQQLQQAYGQLHSQRNFHNNHESQHLHQQMSGRNTHQSTVQRYETRQGHQVAPAAQHQRRERQNEDCRRNATQAKNGKKTTPPANGTNFPFIPSQVMLAEANGRGSATHKPGGKLMSPSQDAGEKKRLAAAACTSHQTAITVAPTEPATIQQKITENASSSTKPSGSEVRGSNDAPACNGASVRTKVYRAPRGRRMGAKFGDGSSNQ